MFNIGPAAGNNRLNGIHPVEKLLLSSPVIFFSMFSRGMLVPVSGFLLMTLLIIFVAHIPVKLYLKLLSIPVTFIVLAALALLIVLSPVKIDSPLCLKIHNYYLGITTISFQKSLLVTIKSLASISGFYFFILTTPFCGLEYLLKKARVPMFLREIILLTYRYIFVFVEFFGQTKKAQELRGGYRNFSTSMNSYGKNFVILFRKILHYSRLSAMALETRGYTGEMNLFNGKNEYQKSARNYFLISMVILLNLFLLIGTG